MSKIIIIGGNHAGTAAINTILDNYKGNEVVVFDSNNNISFLGCGMALWIGKQISSDKGLFYSSKEILEGKGAKIHLQTKVDKIDYNKKIVYAQNLNGTKFEESYDKLILATGSNPILPDIEGINLKNVQLVKLHQNAVEVVEKLKDPSIKNITVVGAGYIGVELAEAFKRNGREVTLIDAENTSLSNYYDTEFTKFMDENLSQNGIKLAFGEKVQKIIGTDKVEKIITDKNEYKTDMVILCIGFKPNNSLVQNGELNLFKNGAILVDKTQKTSLDDVYAIGDCATVYDNSINSVNYIALATNAVRSGIIAGHNVCGNNIESVGVQGSNAISVYGLNMVSTGLTIRKAELNGYSPMFTIYEDLQKPAFMETNNDKVKIKIVYDKDTRVILGAQMCSKTDISMAIHMFSLAIQEKVTIDKLKLLDIFFLPHFNQPYNYITMAALGAE